MGEVQRGVGLIEPMHGGDRRQFAFDGLWAVASRAAQQVAVTVNWYVVAEVIIMPVGAFEDEVIAMTGDAVNWAA